MMTAPEPIGVQMGMNPFGGPPQQPPTPPPSPPTSPYGAPPGGYPGPGATAQKTNGLAIAAMVVGIVGMVTSLFAIGVFFTWIALPLGIVALLKINKSNGTEKGKGMAITGIVLGSIGVIMLGFALLLGAFLFSNPDLLNNPPSY